jgi:hypothetical protein
MCAFGAMTPAAFAAPASAEEVAPSTIQGYSVSFSGGGWGAAKKARVALTKIKGVDKVMLSGMTAFVTTKGDDTKITRSTVRKAFDRSGLKVERVGKKGIPAPKEAYMLAITGGTWAQTNERLRADLEKLDEVSAAFVTSGRITLLMASADSFDEEKIGEMTKKRKSVIKTSTKVSSPL